MADKFRVEEGSMVIFSSSDEGICQAIAKDKTVELIKRGCDVSKSEFTVKVVENT